MLSRQGLSLAATKLKVYGATTFTFLTFYAYETWNVLYIISTLTVQSFHLRCLKKRIHLRWDEHAPETEIP